METVFLIVLLVVAVGYLYRHFASSVKGDGSPECKGCSMQCRNMSLHSDEKAPVSCSLQEIPNPVKGDADCHAEKEHTKE